MDTFLHQQVIEVSFSFAFFQDYSPFLSMSFIQFKYTAYLFAYLE